MSLKGHDFTDSSPYMPLALKRQRADETPEQHVARKKAWTDAQKKRWAIVGQCSECKRDLIEEEVVPHRLNHVPERLRSMARDVAALPREDRVALFGLFTSSGKLKGAE